MYSLFKMFLNFYTVIALAVSVHAHSMMKRMVNAEVGEITDFPYLVYIGNFESTCTGAIVSRTQVLTAAHCVKENNFVVSSGANYIFKGTVHHVKKITIHEKYYKTGPIITWNDIAVVDVYEPFIYDNTTQKIELNHGPKVEPGQEAVILGFGIDFFPAFEYGYLKKLKISISDTAKCNETYSSYGYMKEGQICGRSGSKQSYPCYGDSGGPVVIDNRLVGVIIYGGSCEIKKMQYHVYTDVAYYREWIDRHVNYDEPTNPEVVSIV